MQPFTRTAATSKGPSAQFPAMATHHVTTEEPWLPGLATHWHCPTQAATASGDPSLTHCWSLVVWINSFYSHCLCKYTPNPHAARTPISFRCQPQDCSQCAVLFLIVSACVTCNYSSLSVCIRHVYVLNHCCCVPYVCTVPVAVCWWLLYTLCSCIPNPSHIHMKHNP